METKTLQGLLEQHLPKVREHIKLPVYQHKALDRLSVCRTQALGGHTQYCPNGHVNGIWYNSCKHRACPQCQGLASEEWLRNTQSILLNCPHHHVIFTIPEALNKLWQYNREFMTGVLFKAVQETLREFANDPKYLGATPGILSVLHTWGRNLSLHPHIHVLISHGGLDAKGQWVEPKKGSLFPQKPVMMVFRGKLLATLKKALEQEKLVLPKGEMTHKVKAMLNQQGRKDWVVHFCKRYDHARGVAKYLARYVKGGPFRNQQIKSTNESHLTFSYQSHQTGRKEKLTISYEAFVQRFMQHIPLPRKQSTRYSGLYTSVQREKLNVARKQLRQKPVPKRLELDWSSYLEEKGFRPACSTCGLPIYHGEAIEKLKQIH
ncbi:IS91 family transposase [Alkalimarinus coralli]|uniref:IS91 family transposase n=1 Tax=Alkalimarinus coralli TaxID=2935863 RepID=UPI00202B758A|nr:IS91 family transposase [Alkalimarinus coralli]